MIFQDLNNITDVYNKSGLAIQKMYNQTGDVIWDKSINDIINVNTSFPGVWSTYYNFDNNIIKLRNITKIIDDDKLNTQKRLIKSMSIVNNEDSGLYIFEGNRMYSAWMYSDQREPMPYINPNISNVNTFGSNPTEDMVAKGPKTLWHVKGSGFEIEIDLSSFEKDENNIPKACILWTLPIKAKVIFSDNSYEYMRVVKQCLYNQSVSWWSLARKREEDASHAKYEIYWAEIYNDISGVWTTEFSNGAYISEFIVDTNRDI